MKKSFFDTIPGVVRLDSRVAIYVPSTTDTNHATDNRQQVEEVAAKLSAMFGGATATTSPQGMPPRAFLVPSEQYCPAPHRRPTPRSRLHPTSCQRAIFNPYARGRVSCGRDLL